MAEDLVIRSSVEPDCVLLTPRGRLSLLNAARIGEAALKWLLSNGRVVIDLTQLRVQQAAWVSVFPTALAQAGGWPSARLTMFGADPAMGLTLRSARIPETVHLAGDLGAATALLAYRPDRVRRHRALPNEPTAPRLGRAAVQDACEAWSLPHDTCEVAELLASELVTNAVVHAHSSSRLTLSSTGSRFHIAVRDWLVQPLPPPLPIDARSVRGRGLHLVARLADNWGVEEHQDGKTVWANFKITPPAED